jgi:hypothetical protein
MALWSLDCHTIAFYGVMQSPLVPQEHGYAQAQNEVQTLVIPHVETGQVNIYIKMELVVVVIRSTGLLTIIMDGLLTQLDY